MLDMTNRFEIDSLAARQVPRHFANICHETLDARPFSFFLQVKKGPGDEAILSSPL